MTNPSLTLRQHIFRLLEEREWSARDLAENLQVPVRDLEQHLAHVVKTVNRQPGKQVLMHPSACRDCGFTFNARGRLTRPSRCPKCRSEFISPPRFHISDSGKFTRF